MGNISEGLPNGAAKDFDNDAAESHNKIFDGLANMAYEYVDSPKHYNVQSVETWEMMLRIWGPDKFTAFCEMSAFKYRMRVGIKPDQPAAQDIDKARWYEAKALEIAEGEKAVCDIPKGAFVFDYEDEQDRLDGEIEHLRDSAKKLNLTIPQRRLLMWEDQLPLKGRRTIKSNFDSAKLVDSEWTSDVVTPLIEAGILKVRRVDLGSKTDVPVFDINPEIADAYGLGFKLTHSQRRLLTEGLPLCRTVTPDRRYKQRFASDNGVFDSWAHDVVEPLIKNGVIGIDHTGYFVAVEGQLAKYGL